MASRGRGRSGKREERTPAMRIGPDASVWGSSSDKGRRARSTHAYTFSALARRAQTKEKRLSQRTQVRRASYPVDTDPVRGPMDPAAGVPETDARTVGCTNPVMEAPHLEVELLEHTPEHALEHREEGSRREREQERRGKDEIEEA